MKSTPIDPFEHLNNSADSAVPPPDAVYPRAELPDRLTTEALKATWADPRGLIGTIQALQNDTIGGRIMITAFSFFLVAGLLSLIMRLQLIRPDNTLVAPDTYNELFTMHGSTMMYLFAVPMMEGFAIMLLPFMIGNREMPFPRLGAFSFVTLLLGGLLFFSSYLNFVPIGVQVIKR
ncbi:MAG: cbb3-type cytochrome c oxidase subunit I [Chloroflexi bacterium]|nr:cbb3-type cytochrome c oxidase subunit I [Chloroflexota bacterium]